jgi:hypothetical protein
VVIEVGGLLGLGGYLVAVPFESVDRDDPSDGIVLKGATQEALFKRHSAQQDEHARRALCPGEVPQWSCCF